MRAIIRKAALVAAFAVATTSNSALAAPGADATFASGTLAGGGQYLLRRTAAAPVAAVALWYRAPQAGFDPVPTPGLGRLAAATIAASTTITGRSLSQVVAEAGGRIVVSAYPDSVAVSMLVPADRAADVVRAATAAYFTPVLDAQGLALAQRDLSEEAFIRQFNPEDAIGDLLLGALFADGPAHAPGLSAPAALKAVTIDRLRSYAERAFRPGNAVLVVTGAVAPDVLDAAVPGRSAAAPGSEPAIAAHPVPLPSPVSESGMESGAGLGWVGPAIIDERDATALDFIADYLFRPDTGVVTKPFAGTLTSVTGKYVTYHDPGVFLVTISGGDVDAAKSAVESAIARVRSPLPPAVFAAAIAAFRYHMLSDVQTPAELADTLGWYAVEGDPLYAPGAAGSMGRYFQAIDALTPASVAAAAAKYLGTGGAVVAVTTKKAEAAK